MKVQILTTLPTVRTIVRNSGNLPNMVACNSVTGLEASITGNGAVNCYTWQDGVWKKHPQGSGIEDDGSYTRMVISDNQVYACLVDETTSTDSDTVARLAAVNFGD